MMKLALLVLWVCSLMFLAGRTQGVLELNYYAKTCPRAEEIVKEQVNALYHEHGDTAVSWLRLIFHDCIVDSCDASILLEDAPGVESEQNSDRNFGMRNFKYIEVIKSALESECPGVVSCADLISLSAREGIMMLGGPRIEVKTGRKDSKKCSAGMVDQQLPLHNDSISVVLSRFASIGIDTEGAMALLGAHTVGRTHCLNLVKRLYPSADPTIDPVYAMYLKGRCPTAYPDPNPEAVVYARNDRGTPMKFDNNYYKNLVKHQGLLLIDQQLLSDPRTTSYVQHMAQDNDYFFAQFSRALIILSEHNPLSPSQGDVRKACNSLNMSP